MASPAPLPDFAAAAARYRRWADRVDRRGHASVHVQAHQREAHAHWYLLTPARLAEAYAGDAALRAEYAAYAARRSARQDDDAAEHERLAWRQEQMRRVVDFHVAGGGASVTSARASAGESWRSTARSMPARGAPDGEAVELRDMSHRRRRPEPSPSGADA